MSISVFKKVLFIFSFWSLLMILEACGPDCNCPAVLPYFDFQASLLEVENTQIDAEMDLQFIMQPANIDYLATTKPCKAPMFSKTAFGCSCLWNGYDGMKYPLESFRMYSDANFNDTLLAGENLANYLEVYEGGGFDYTQAQTLEEAMATTYNAFLASEIETGFRLPIRPTADSVHHFRIELVKSNSDTVWVDVGEMKWL